MGTATHQASGTTKGKHMNDEENPQPDIGNEMAFAMIAIRNMLEPIISEVEGYRKAMLEKGYNDYDARSMAVDYHGALMRMICK